MGAGTRDCAGPSAKLAPRPALPRLVHAPAHGAFCKLAA